MKFQSPQRGIVTSCTRVASRGEGACLGSCAMDEKDSVFSYVRVEKDSEPPPADSSVVDVAVLDMNHGWPNLGHNSIVHAVREAACDFEKDLRAASLQVRAISYDVRRSGLVPRHDGRFKIYLGTGGPGHLDPSKNDGVADFSQGIREDGSWERHAFKLFDDILEDENAALMAVCHSFGIMCRWKSLASPVVRGAEKGGKSAGILENVLTSEGRRHPWFSRFSSRLGGKPDRFKMIDSRLFDLIPNADSKAPLTRFSFESAPNGNDGPGEALTGVEIARDRNGVLPRVMGVNHHPEIMDPDRQLLVLEKLRAQGAVTKEWYEERVSVVARSAHAPELDQELALTTGFTFVWPLRFHLARQIRERAGASRSFGLHEEQILERAHA